MNELVPGVFHWTAEHPRIHMPVSSYYLAEARTVLDPMVPPEGLGWFGDDHPVDRIVLTNRHHDRDSKQYVDALKVPVLVPESGLHEFEGKDLDVEPYRPGDEVAPGVLVHDSGAICPDDMVLEIKAAKALAIADGVIRYGHFMFVPDQLMGDPEKDKRAIVDSLRPLLELDFDTVMVAHGEPQASGAKADLQRFVDEFEG